MARYIDADKFLKDETKRCGSVPIIGSCTTDNESLAYVLAQTPTADVVEVRHGEWEKVHYSKGCIAPYQHTCSCCGKSYWDCWAENRFTFCPNCGAKMDGGENENV